MIFPNFWSKTSRSREPPSVEQLNLRKFPSPSVDELQKKTGGNDETLYYKNIRSKVILEKVINSNNWTGTGKNSSNASNFPFYRRSYSFFTLAALDTEKRNFHVFWLFLPIFPGYYHPHSALCCCCSVSYVQINAPSVGGTRTRSGVI